MLRHNGFVDLGWVWTGNLLPFATELARLAGYAFCDSDWAAIEHGIRGTDAEAGQWFQYPLGRITVKTALEPGADEMAIVAVAGVADGEQQLVSWLGDIMRNWHLSAPEPA